MLQALGEEEVDRIARESGVSSEEAAQGLATVIPETVDHLTPEGNVPDEATIQQRFGSLSGKFPGL